MREQDDAGKRDGLVEIAERAERSVVAFAFLVAKVVSVIALLLALILLEAGVVVRIWKAEFSDDAHSLPLPSAIVDKPSASPPGPH
jgi:hypothetical protein